MIARGDDPPYPRLSGEEAVRHGRRLTAPSRMPAVLLRGRPPHPSAPYPRLSATAGPIAKTRDRIRPAAEDKSGLVSAVRAGDAARIRWPRLQTRVRAAWLLQEARNRASGTRAVWFAWEGAPGLATTGLGERDGPGH